MTPITTLKLQIYFITTIVMVYVCDISQFAFNYNGYSMSLQHILSQ